MNNIGKILLIIFLLFWWINFEFVDRLSIFSIANISLFKILSSIITLFVLINIFIRRKVRVLPISINAILLIIVSISFISFVISENIIYNIPFSILDRYLTQLFSLFNSFFLSLFIFDCIKNYTDKFFKFLKYGYILVFLSVLWQIFFIGLDFFPRLFGLAGEPKALGLILVPFISALYFEGLDNKLQNWILLCVSVLILAFTLSSTSFLALFLVFLLILYFSSTNVNFVYRLLFWLISLVIPLVFIINFYDLDEVVFGRVLNRAVGDYVSGVQTVVEIPIIGIITVDGNDAPVARMFLEKPWILFSGVGYGFQTVFSYEYLLKYDSGFLDKFYSGYITPNIALLNHFSNFGLLIFIFIFLDGLRSVKFLLKFSFDSKLRFILIYFSSWFILSSLIYEMTFKIFFLYIILKLFKVYLKNIIHDQKQYSIPLF